eukprot:362332-Chlamydomonas_euryale.AAC.2
MSWLAIHVSVKWVSPSVPPTPQPLAMHPVHPHHQLAGRPRLRRVVAKEHQHQAAANDAPRGQHNQVGHLPRAAAAAHSGEGGAKWVGKEQWNVSMLQGDT